MQESLPCAGLPRWPKNSGRDLPACNAKCEQKMNTRPQGVGRGAADVAVVEQLGTRPCVEADCKELLIEIANLKLRLEEFASVNAGLEERLEACESQNKRLRLENELLYELLRNRDYRENDDHCNRAALPFSVTNFSCHELGGMEGDYFESQGGNYSGEQLPSAAVSNDKLSQEEEKIEQAMAARTWKLDTETANRLLTGLEDAPLHMSYCDSELRYVWFNHVLEDLTHQEIAGKRDDEIFARESEGVRQLIELKHKAVLTGLTQVEIKKCLMKLRAEMTAHKATEDELRRAVQVTGILEYGVLVWFEAWC